MFMRIYISFNYDNNLLKKINFFLITRNQNKGIKESISFIDFDNF